jgi:hypothetical protein
MEEGCHQQGDSDSMKLGLPEVPAYYHRFIAAYCIVPDSLLLVFPFNLTKVPVWIVNYIVIQHS